MVEIPEHLKNELKQTKAAVNRFFKGKKKQAGADTSSKTRLLGDEILLLARSWSSRQ